MLVLAHRGDQRRFPENTAPALVGALERGAHGLEIDAQLTGDGQVAVIHDSRLERTCNGSGAVADLPWEVLGRLDAGVKFAAAFAGTPLLRLEEALAIAGGAPVNIHLKSQPKGWNKLVQAVVRLVIDADSLTWAYLSGDRPCLEWAKSLEPRIEVCYLGPQPRNNEAYLHQSRALGCRILQIPHEQLDSAFVGRAHQLDLVVYALHLAGSDQDPQAVRQGLLQAGVNGVVTDFVDLYVHKPGRRQL